MVGEDRVGTAPGRLSGVCQQRGLLHARRLKWVLALVTSCTIILDGHLRLIPVLDLANHGDGTSTNDVPQELLGGSFGAFRTTKGARLLTLFGKDGGVCENLEVLVSYGPKTPADPSTPFSLTMPSAQPPVCPLRLT